MTARHSGSHETMRSKRAPRYPSDRPFAASDTVALRAFREHTSGLSNRIPLPSMEAMRVGTVMSPHAAVRRYLLSARGIGLPKEWALQFSAFVQTTVDALWPMEATSLRVLEERAMVAEAKDDLAEKRCDLERNAITLRERIQTQTDEIVCDQLTLAKLERDILDMEGAK